MVNPEYRTYVLVDVANVSRGAQNVDGQRDDNVRVSNRELVKILDDGEDHGESSYHNIFMYA